MYPSLGAHVLGGWGAGGTLARHRSAQKHSPPSDTLPLRAAAARASRRSGGMWGLLRRVESSSWAACSFRTRGYRPHSKHDLRQV